MANLKNIYALLIVGLIGSTLSIQALLHVQSDKEEVTCVEKCMVQWDTDYDQEWDADYDQEDVKNIIAWMKKNLNKHDITEARFVEIVNVLSDRLTQNEQKIVAIQRIIEEDKVERYWRKQEEQATKAQDEQQEDKWERQQLRYVIISCVAIIVAFPLIIAGGMYAEALVRYHIKDWNYNKVGDALVKINLVYR